MGCKVYNRTDHPSTLISVASLSSEPQGSFVRLDCRRGRTTLAFRAPGYAFRSNDAGPAILGVDDYPPTASEAYGYVGGSIAFVNMSRLTYSRVLAAHRIELLMALPGENGFSFTYNVSGIEDFAGKLREGCPESNFPDSDPIPIKPDQVSKYLAGKIKIDGNARKLIDATTDQGQHD
jgi:hypothetical protein